MPRESQQPRKTNRATDISKERYITTGRSNKRQREKQTSKNIEGLAKRLTDKSKERQRYTGRLTKQKRALIHTHTALSDTDAHSYEN